MMIKRRHRTGLAVATVGATAGLMITALPFMPGVGANTLVPETAVMPEGPVPPVIRYGAMAYAPSGAWGRTRDMVLGNGRSKLRWTSAESRIANSSSGIKGAVLSPMMARLT